MSSLSISNISQLLDDPKTITGEYAGQIKTLQEQYPYFAIGNYLEAARIHNQQPFSADVLNIMHNSNSNWMLFHSFLSKAAAAPANYTLPVSTARPVDTVTTSPEDDIMAELSQPVKIPGAASPAAEDRQSHVDASTPISFTTDEPIGGNDTTGLDSFSSDINTSHLNLFGDDMPLQTFEDEAEPKNEPEETAARPIGEEPVTEEENLQQNEIETEHEEQIPAASTNNIADAIARSAKDNTLIQPIYTEDYFLHEGVEISNELPEADELAPQHTDSTEQSLMVMRSFVEWLAYFKTKSREQQEEEEDKKALKTRLQKQKLAAAIEEENEEIPEQVFEMAVNSITQEDGLASESLAEIYVKQGKYDKAIDMYRKLSLRNPQKNTYFARKIEEVLKEKQS